MNKYTEELKEMLKYSEIEAIELKSDKVSTAHFLLALLKHDDYIIELFEKENINYNNFINEIKSTNKFDLYLYYSIEFKRVIESSIYMSKDMNLEEININTVLYNILNNKNDTINILNKLKCNINFIKNELKKNINKNTKLLLFDIGTNLNEQAINNELDKVIGRDKEINRVIEILSRKNKNNPVLIGEAGVGKTAIVEELARRIVNNDVPKVLENKTIVSLSLSNVIAGTKYRGEFEEKMSKIIKELELNDNLILFIDEIHTLVGAGGAEGAIDASNILKPMLARGKIRCIGATTIKEYKQFIESDKALDRRFQKVLVEETNIKETKNILYKIKEDYESYHNVTIEDNIIDYIIKMSNKYIFDRKDPDKSIDILDEVCAKASILNYNKNLNSLNQEKKEIENLRIIELEQNNYDEAIKLKKKERNLENKIKKLNESKVLIEEYMVNSVIENKINSSITDNIDKNKMSFLLNKLIINQRNAINDLLEINLEDKPLSVLVEGPKGVGKTSVIKEYAKLNNLNLLEINLNEYKSDISLNKIFGSPEGYIGYNDNNTLFEIIRTKPNTLILFHNFSHANNNIKEVIFDIIKNKQLKLYKGEIINFSNCVFVFENSTIISSDLGFIKNNKTKANSSEENIDYKITFNSLSEKDIKEIIKSKKNFNASTINKLLKESNFEIYGASKIDKLINKQSVVNK